MSDVSNFNHLTQRFQYTHALILDQIKKITHMGFEYLACYWITFQVQGLSLPKVIPKQRTHFIK